MPDEYPVTAAEPDPRFRAIFEGATDVAIIAINPGGHVTEWNQGAEHMLGWTASDMHGQKIDRIFTPRDQDEGLAGLEMRAALETGRGGSEGWRLRKDGTRFWAGAEMLPLRGHDGTHLGFMNILRDRSEQKQAQEALKRSERTLHAVLDALPVGVVIADAEGRIIRDNAAHRALWGLPPDTVGAPGDQPWAGWHVDTGQPINADEWAMFRALKSGEVVRGELVECQRFGAQERRFFLNNAAPVRDDAGRIVAGVAIALDVTEARQAERAAAARLADSEARFRALADNMPQLAWMARPDGHVFWYNRRWFDYTGTTLAEMEGWGWQAVHHPDHVERVTKRIQHSWDTGEPWEDTFPLRRGDGVYRWFLSRAEPIQDADGNIALWFGTNTDVTQQRAVEAALDERSERLRLALEAGQMGVWSLDLTTGALEWDIRQFQLFGLDPRQGEHVRAAPTLAGAMALVHPADRPGIEAAMSAARESATGVFSYEFRVVPPAGPIRWIGGYGRAIPEPDGPPRRMIGLNFDVTERRETQEALAASGRAAQLAAERVQLALDAGAIIGTWIWDLPTDRFTADERFARSFGLDPAVCEAGLGIEAVVASVHPDDKPRLMDAIAEALERGGHYSCEYRVRQHDGRYRWIEANGRVDLAPDGTALRFPGVLLDIEARRAIQAERDRATALLRTFAEAIPGVAYAKDRDGRLLIANAGAVALFGKPLDSIVGRTEAEFLENKAQAEVVMANDRRIMEAGLTEQVEEAVSLPDGTPAFWLSTKAPFRNNAGEVVGLVAASVDITARKQAEAVLARDKAELERLVVERTRDLEETQGRLAHAQRMEALGQLAGGIAHDFNNVLQAAKGGLALIQRRPDDTDAVLRLARMAGEAIERGSAITRRLLAFSRRGDLRAEAVDAAALLLGMREILMHTLGAGIGVRVEAPAGLPPLLADKSQLETVLVNMATNARDAMAGNGTLTLSAHHAELPRADRPGHAPALTAGTYVRLSVTDTGSGIAPYILARVTEPFFTTKPMGKGTGLGLAMARGFAEQSGGGLFIDSAPGRGTTVSLWLPIASGGVTRAEAGGRAPVQPIGEAPRILLVDDEDLVREIVAEQLEDLGYDVVQAGGGAAALPLLDAEGRVDLMVCDLSMPRMNGVQLIQEAQRRRPNLPAILLTGYAGDAATLAVGDAVTGPFSLLRKPVTAPELGERIAVLLKMAGP